MSCLPEALPWGRERTLRALMSTTWLVVAHGPSTFASRVGIREDEPTVSYASTVAVGTFAPLLAVPFLAVGSEQGGGALGLLSCCWVGMALPMAAISQLFRGAVYGALYHGLARLLGGTASPSSSFSAAYFSLGVLPAQLLLVFCGMLPTLVAPELGVTWLFAGLGVAYVVSILWGVALVFQHARARHELGVGRAVVAALVPSLLGLVPYGFGLARTIGIAGG